MEHWKSKYKIWYLSRAKYFPTPSECCDWFEENVLKDINESHKERIAILSEQVPKGAFLKLDKVCNHTVEMHGFCSLCGEYLRTR